MTRTVVHPRPCPDPRTAAAVPRRGPPSLAAGAAARRAARRSATGPAATRAAVEHLGYVQIDTINVIERSHHHILWSRIPDYRRADLHHALSVEKSVFEYWAHALAYVPTRDFRFFMPEMRRHREARRNGSAAVSPADVRRVVARIRRDGALSIRDIDDDELVDKDHPWASRKPSKRALQLAFFAGALTVSERAGMLKTYELTDRHFGWPKRPRPASEAQVLDYLLDRALRSQGVVSLELDLLPRRAAQARDRGADRGAGAPRAAWFRSRSRVRADANTGSTPEAAGLPGDPSGPVHLLSPFDPLVIQRKRLKLFFGYEHRFEAYVPKAKRRLGYFALPVLIGDRIAAAIDLKADRERRAAPGSAMDLDGRPGRR